MESGAEGGAPRLAEVLAALSLATDLGVGQPMEHALRACQLAVLLGREGGLDEERLRPVYYAALLQRIGCTADSFELVAWFDDEIAAHARSFTLDFARPAEVVGDLLRHAGAGRPPLERLRALARALAGGQAAIGRLFAASCEVAERLASRLELGGEVQRALAQSFERWDGQGWPAGLRGEALVPAARLARLAGDALAFARLGGVEGAIALVRQRAGRVYDPALAERFSRQAPRLLAELEAAPAWEGALALEPRPQRRLAGAELDRALRVLADFTDLKSPHAAGHSSGVAELALEAARRWRLPEADQALAYRAGLVHDLGRVGVPGGIWERSGPLSRAEWERVRLHPYFTERILARPRALAQVGAVAALHHERLDGSGYVRGALAPALSPVARLLAAADAYHAMAEPRPHRPPLAPEAAAQELRRAARAGLLDSEAVNAVLAAAGHHVRRRRSLPAGLSAREVEVLRLAARGHSTRDIARRLTISPHTAGHHVRHIYAKIGVSTRAAATLFALQHDLLDPLTEE